MWRRRVPPIPPSNSLDSSWVSYNSTQFGDYLPRDSVRFHRWRVLSYKTHPLHVHTHSHTSEANCKPRLLPMFLTKQLNTRGLHHSLLKICWFASRAHRSQRNICSQNDQLIRKGCNSCQIRVCGKGHKTSRSCRFSILSMEDEEGPCDRLPYVRWAIKFHTGWLRLFLGEIVLRVQNLYAWGFEKPKFKMSEFGVK